MAHRIPKYIILVVLTIFFTLIFACSDESQNAVDDVGQSAQASNLNNASNPPLPPGIPSFPYIFSGKFYINGEEGEKGSKIVARLGDLYSPIIETTEGEYKNLIIGPKNENDVKNNIEFFLVLENGEEIKAKEEIKFEITKIIVNSTIELNFEK